MATTPHFGLSKFPPGAITDDGNKFSSKDRDIIDNLLHTLFNHDHGDSLLDIVEGPSPLIIPETALGTAGTLAAGRSLFYKISYIDDNGNETAASAPAVLSTPAPIAAPLVPSVLVETTGGTLIPGTYRYAFAYYQGTGQTTAQDIVTVVVPVGTSTNKITFTFDIAPDEADGWKVYRRSPDETDYWLLATVADTETDFVDDGTLSPDCTKRRSTANTTNSSNSVTVSIPPSELPLDTRITAWRIYRTQTTSVFPASSLLATVTETTTEGGSDLVTSFVDTGQNPGPGTPLLQSAVPPIIPQLDAEGAFAASGGRLPAGLAPLGVHQLHVFMPGTLTARTYLKFEPRYDILASKLEGYFLDPPDCDGTDYVTLRAKDDVTAPEIQSIVVSYVPRNEIQQVVKSIAANTWTLTFDGEITAAIAAAPTTLQIKTALENLPNVVTVNVINTGTRTWTVEFVDPGGEDVPQMTGTVSGGLITVTTLIQGSDGGTFTLSDGVDPTSAISVYASAGTLETRLQTDITSIVDVTVTGTGTEADPWIVTWVDPDDVAVPVLQMNKTLIVNGTGSVSRVQRGHGPTVIDLPIQDTVDYYSWDAPALLEDAQEAEDAPATSDGTDVSDGLTGDGQATELDIGEGAAWAVGVLEAGLYTARFFVRPMDSTLIELRVIDDNGPTTLATLDVSESKPSYSPAYEVEFETDGTADILFTVENISGGDCRVDRYEWEVVLPTLHAGSPCEIEALITGTPVDEGGDVQFSLWY